MGPIRLIGLIGLMGLTVICAMGQQNTISFTNHGDIISNAIPVRVDRSRLIYRTENGGGTIKLVDLPPTLQERFGYDSARAAKDEAADLERRKRQSEAALIQMAATASATENARVRREVEAKAELIFAHVIQRLDGRLIIDASGDGVGGNRGYYEDTPEAKKLVGGRTGAEYWKIPMARGTILLEDYCRINQVVDGDKFITVGYPIGTYEYTAVSGGRKTIRKYTGNLDVAAPR